MIISKLTPFYLVIRLFVNLSIFKNLYCTFQTKKIIITVKIDNEKVESVG